jgi:hypothetical protein
VSKVFWPGMEREVENGLKLEPGPRSHQGVVSSKLAICDNAGKKYHWSICASLLLGDALVTAPPHSA